jgi:ubiquinone/menaquinone biosynthesis C-methylase UbiE
MKTKILIKDVIITASDLTEEQIRETVEAYSKNAASYAKMWVWNPAYRTELGTQAKKFLRYVEYGAKVLVPGAGVGRDTEMLVDEGFECTALDISSKVLNEAKSRGVKAEYVVHDIRQPLPFPDRSFDAVYSDSVLEHIPKKDIKKVLNEFYRVLIPRGILYAGVKKGEGEIYYRYDVGSKRHRRFYITYTGAEFHKLLAEAGFVMLEEWIDEHMDPKTHVWLAGIFRKNP